MRMKLKTVMVATTLIMLILLATATVWAANRPSTINAYWTTGEADTTNDNYKETCPNPARFQAIWLPPIESTSPLPGNITTYKIADEWEVELSPIYGASNARASVSYELNQDGTENRQYPKLDGRVNIGTGYNIVGIKVRGRFDGSWGDWSPRSSVICKQSRNLRTLRGRTPAPVDTNSAATGVPTINGTNTAGNTLTAVTSGITDTNGMKNTVFSYQWLRSDSAILGATTSTYTLVSADAGNTIKVRVSFTDDSGNSESATSTGLDIPATTLYPIRPTGLTFTSISQNSVTLSWDNPTDSSITNYQILRRSRDGDEYGDGDGASAFVAVTDNTGSATTSYTDSSVTPRTRYVYRVKARNTAGLSPQSSYLNVETP